MQNSQWYIHKWRCKNLESCPSGDQRKYLSLCSQREHKKICSFIAFLNYHSIIIIIKGYTLKDRSPMSYKTVCTLISQFLIHKNRGLREINFYYYYYCNLNNGQNRLEIDVSFLYFFFSAWYKHGRSWDSVRSVFREFEGRSVRAHTQGNWRDGIHPHDCHSGTIGIRYSKNISLTIWIIDN